MEMTKEERYEVNNKGELVIGIPKVPADRKRLVEQLFSRFGWKYELLLEITQSHYYIKVTNENLDKSYTFHLYHGNVRKEDPDRNRSEKKIQLGGLDPREIKNEMCIILGFYIYEDENIENAIIVAWPVEDGKNYPNNPSLRVNMKQDVLPAKNGGIYFDQTTGKKIVVFQPDFIYYYLEQYETLHGYGVPQADKDVEPDECSPEWFAQKALLYLDNEVEAKRLYQDFREKFGPDALRAVDGLDLLHKIFINETRDKENLCYTLEFSKQYTQFGGIGGGSALKYGLYFDAKKNSWVTGTWKNLKILTVDEAIELGALMRNEILAGVDIIQNHAELTTAQDYLTLNAELFSVMPTTMNKAWVMKYFHMMFPDLFPPFYNLEWQDKVLTAIDEESDDNSFVRIGKIALFIKKCGISSLAFSKVVYNMENLENSEEEQEAPIVTTNYTFETTKGGAQNKVVYGTPGCGKSYYVQNDYLVKLGVEKEDRIRTAFYQDYTNTDFVGQILPKVVRAKNEGETDEVTYEFNPGPFALALKKAIEHSDRPVALIIEELNRGNAASIFGDIFQLLDRDKNGKSQYDITNINLQDYLTKEFAEQHYIFNSISLPGNLYIVATMNTSDQNVFTLDTAFKRRWQFEKIRNKFTADHEYKGYFIPGMEDVTWEKLVDDINDYIVRTPDDLASEDKQLGVYFIDKELLCKTQEECSNKAKAKRFAYKLFEYLWDDVAKYAHSDWFNEVKTLDELIDAYIDKGGRVFVDGIIKQDN